MQEEREGQKVPSWGQQTEFPETQHPRHYPFELRLKGGQGLSGRGLPPRLDRRAAGGEQEDPHRMGKALSGRWGRSAEPSYAYSGSRSTKVPPAVKQKIAELKRRMFFLKASRETLRPTSSGVSSRTGKQR